MISIPAQSQLPLGAVLLLDKPYTWTSFDVVKRLRKTVGAKVGHCGTLDPLATGLLILCTGKMTKEIDQFMKLPKEYTGIITLGASTPTYDLESQPEHETSIAYLTEEKIQEMTSSFIGAISQVPPIHSAIKKDGKRAYELARAGKEIVLQPRAVSIDTFEIKKIEGNDVWFKVNCSTGTYIRSLAHDFGKALGCGGYLKALRRTKIGPYSVEDAGSPNQYLEYWQAESEVK